MAETPTPTYRDRFDPLDPGLAAPDATSTAGPSERFWSTLRAMRTECPVAHSDAYGMNQWVVTRHEDVTAVARDWATFTSEYGGAPVAFDDGEAQFKLRPLDLDPPEHRSMRKLLNPYFGVGAVASREREIRAIAAEIIDDFAGKGSCEFMSSFAIPFPARVFFRLYLGLPTRDLVEVLGWVDQMVMHPEKAEETIGRFAPWIVGIFEQRKTTRRDDVLDALVHGEIDGRPLTDTERLETVLTLIIAGLETTANAIGNAIMHLAADAALRDKVIALDDVATACDELLRFEAPAPGLARTCTRDTQLGGQRIAAGDRVLVYYGSANRDAEVWKDPDTIDITRPDARKHYSFGFGIHRCLGAHLAELELRIALEELLKRLPDLRLDPGQQVAWRNAFSRGPAQLAVLFEPAATP
jgi:cytochrome P450